MAEDGRVSIVGRAKDLIIAGGLNVYPREIELGIDAVPGVAESAVISGHPISAKPWLWPAPAG